MKEETNSGITYSGYIPDLLDALTKISAYTYTLTHIPSNQYGAKINGTWTGLVGELVNNVNINVQSSQCII